MGLLDGAYSGALEVVAATDKTPARFWQVGQRPELRIVIDGESAKVEVKAGDREPADVLHDAAVGQIRDDDEIRPLFEQRDELIVDVEVTHAVRERVDAGAHERFRIGEVVLVGDRAQARLVRFVDDGAVELRRELRVLAHAVVDPDLGVRAEFGGNGIVGEDQQVI